MVAHSRFGPALVVAFLLTGANGFASTYEAITSPIFFDTQPPTFDALTAPETAPLSGAAVSYLAVSDASGVARVELWAREDGELSWTDTLLFSTNGLGNEFVFVPVGEGLYHFDLVMEDTVGNRTVTPLSSASFGATRTEFSNESSVDDWMLLSYD